MSPSHSESAALATHFSVAIALPLKKSDRQMELTDQHFLYYSTTDTTTITEFQLHMVNTFSLQNYILPGCVRFGVNVVLLNKEAGQRVVMKEEVGFFIECELPLPLHRREHCPYHIKWTLQDKEE